MHRNFPFWLALPLIVAVASGLGLTILRTQQVIEQETALVRSHQFGYSSGIILPGFGDGEEEPPMAKEVDTSNWTRYENPKLGFAFLLPDYVSAGEPEPDLPCLAGENAATFVRETDDINQCAFAVLIDDDAAGQVPREWLEEHEGVMESLGITYFKKIQSLGGVWQKIRLGDIAWTFVAEPKESEGEVSYTALSSDGSTIVYVFLPELLSDYGIHDAILSTFEFID